MHRSIGADQRYNRTEDAHKRGEPHTLPIATIVELSEDTLRRRVGGKNPKRDEDGDESTDVQDQYRRLNGRQDFSQDGVDEERHADESYCQ